MVNHSDAGWYGGPKVPIWCGEVHLYHSECLSKKNKRLHEHDPKGCYACSGSASFEYNRLKAYNNNLKNALFGSLPRKGQK